MHPILARYLDADAAAEVLRREENGEVLRAEERPLAEAARSLPEHRAALLGARGARAREPEAQGPGFQAQPPAPGGRHGPAQGPGFQAQQSALVLAAHAALRALEADEGMAPALRAAREALRGEGAAEAEADQLLATLLLEEAFGYEDDPDQFDREFVRSSLEEIPELARLTRARVDELVRTFGEKAEPGWATAHELAARQLFEAAWSEGPQAINPEHLTEALEALEAKLPPSERGRATESLRRMVEHLRAQRLVSAERARRLEAVLGAREAGGERGLKQ